MVVGKHFHSNLKGDTMSKHLADYWQRVKDELTVMFLTEPRFQLTADDHEAVRQAREMIRQVYGYKACHYACCALYASGEFKCGTHICCRRMHEFSVCAEHRPIERAHYRQQKGDPDPIVTLATFHGGHDTNGQKSGEPYLASPCEKCLRLLEQVSPDCLIVIDLDGQGRLAKIPLEAVEFFRHPRRHNGE
jgi:cytidine deaminase